MLLNRTTPCQVFEIRTPVWGGRKVGLATYKIGTHNEVRILTKDKYGQLLFPQPLYISGEKARTFPVEAVKSNRAIKLHVIPVNELEVLERTV